MARKWSKSANTTNTSLPERDVSTQHAEFNVHTTSNSQDVVSRVTSDNEAMQYTSVTSDLQRNQNFSFIYQTDTANTFSYFDSNGKHSGYTPQTPTLNIKADTYGPVLPVVMLSDNVGYITSPGFDDNEKYPNNYHGTFSLSVAHNESLLTNVVELHFEWYMDYLIFTQISRKGTETTQCMYDRGRDIAVYVYRNSLRIEFHTSKKERRWGFKILFAILPRFQEPELLPGRLFNCTVPNFHRFSLLLKCNMLTECEGGEDERNCSYRDNDCGMEDAISTGTKCYSLVLNQPDMSWFDAHKNCIERGQKLAILENPEVLRHVISRLPYIVNLKGYFLGAQLKDRLLAISISAMYKHIWQWVDGSTIFSIQFYRSRSSKGFCAVYDPWDYKHKYVSCYIKKRVSAFVCEFHKQNEIQNSITLADKGINVSVNSTTVIWYVNVVQCPSDHVTRDFLSCDFEADCDATYSVTSCSNSELTVPMFTCQRSRSTVHYTLVCDHMHHCSDNSDEDFCIYPECPMSSTKCRNDQCIHWKLLCDGKPDCYDGSDEMCRREILSLRATSPPGSVYLDGEGIFWTRQLNASDKCPSTHFLCPRGFCLPVYLRCNGVVDCFGREDEVGCDTYKCRGFYRCRGSKVCLHVYRVCDIIPHCPEQDDEMLCHPFVCPHECRCQGLAFVCTSNFSAISYVSLRYLDASGSNMTLTDVRYNIHLIALRLSKCQMTTVPLNVIFSNLIELDLSWNKLNQLHMHHVHLLKNMRKFILTGNPLVKITSFNSKSGKSLLEFVDLSHTSLEEFSGNEFAGSSNIKVFNISRSKLRSIAEYAFKMTPRLEDLDLRVFHLKNIPRNLLRHLRFLKTMHAHNFKLCCEAILPRNFHVKNCHSTHDLLASCDDLLKSNTYRIFLWVFALLSFMGNVFSVGVRLYRQQEGSFSVFVTNLSVADLFMGVYLTIIGTADFVYRGSYLWRDDEWKTSVTCNIAGFLCLLSSETSAFIICLITLDRFLVLRFPFGRLHFRRRSALVASGAVWAVGVSLAAIPLLPMTSHWEFYSQTGICVPLPFTTSDFFHGYDYSFGVSILLNLVLFLFIAVGQVVVYWAVHANSMPSSTNTQTRDAAIARRLLTVVVSDFLCWFPIGLLGLLTFTGTPIPGDLNVAVATFVLPVNSALNPFLYTFNLLMEKRRKAQHEKLLKRLELERRGQMAVMKGKSQQVPESVDKTVVIQQIKSWIRENVLTSEDLHSC